MAVLRSQYRAHSFMNDCKFSLVPSKGVGSPIRISLVTSTILDSVGDMARLSMSIGVVGSELVSEYVSSLIHVGIPNRNCKNFVGMVDHTSKLGSIDIDDLASKVTNTQGFGMSLRIEYEV